LPIEQERLDLYLEKALREGKVSTDWLTPNEEHERAVQRYAARAAELLAGDAFLERIRAAGLQLACAQLLLKLTAPGIPDIYRGDELEDLSLVDPDNRRAVDYARRRELLQQIDAGALPEIDETGAAKLLVVAQALRLRRARPELFTGYTPLTATGPAAEHVVAFDRGGAIAVATRLPVRLAESGWWRDTAIDVGSAPVRDVITGRGFPGGALPLSELLVQYPVALLVTEGGKP
jgi:(1->4)-alpha-D-glucan 1-alpha-D-glucosylmutase